MPALLRGTSHSKPDVPISVHPAPSNHRGTGLQTQNPIRRPFSGIDLHLAIVLKLPNIWSIVVPFKQDFYGLSPSVLFV